jgi:hypothetical protein
MNGGFVSSLRGSQENKRLFAFPRLAHRLLLLSGTGCRDLTATRRNLTVLLTVRGSGFKSGGGRLFVAGDLRLAVTGEGRSALRVRRSSRTHYSRPSGETAGPPRKGIQGENELAAIQGAAPGYNPPETVSAPATSGLGLSERTACGRCFAATVVNNVVYISDDSGVKINASTRAQVDLQRLSVTSTPAVVEAGLRPARIHALASQRRRYWSDTASTATLRQHRRWLRTEKSISVPYRKLWPDVTAPASGIRGPSLPVGPVRPPFQTAWFLWAPRITSCTRSTRRPGRPSGIPARPFRLKSSPPRPSPRGSSISARTTRPTWFA